MAATNMSTNDIPPSGADAGPLSGEEMQAALFAQLVLQQTNLVLMLLGKTPNPQTGETSRDLEAARLFIDQLEMLEAKTKGNLTPAEARLLQQSLMTARLAFVEVVEGPSSPEPAQTTSSATGTKAESAPESAPGTAAEEESRKRFSKKY